MKKLFVFIILVLGVNAVNAQRYFDERYISSLAFLNPVIVNPGATGFDDDHHVLLNYKNKWASFPGTPKSLILSYDGPIADRLGFGALLVTDSNGALETSKFQGSVSYRIDAPTNKIGFGLSAEFIQHGLSNDVFTSTLVSTDDMLILQRLEGANYFDVSFGVQGLYNQKLSYGLAFPSLVSSRIEDNGESEDREIGYLFNVGYKFDGLDSGLVLEPSLFVKNLMNVPFHADINLLGRFLEDRLLGGITYTVGGDDKLGFLIGVGVNAFNFTYAYNASRNEFQSYNNGSHELSLRFDISANNRRNATDDMEEGMIDETIIKSSN